MILGTGIDLCDVERIRAKLQAAEEEFLQAVFLPGEIAYCRAKKHPAEHFAARFAAKEAVVKALADARGEGSFWLDIEIRKEQDGRPVVRLHGRAHEMADRLKVRRVLLSMTHTRDLAAATVVLEG
jgi:holo-[acyl-carrier protein] synthase